MSQPTSPLTRCLIGVIFGLLLVGLVSGTPLRHFLQVLPVAFALILVSRRVSWASYSALPIFAFWLLLMTLIWLHLLGLVHLITGDFSKSEIILTIFIGVWCLFGLLLSVVSLSPARLTTRLSAFLGFATLQIAALWLSLQPYFARR
jgi:hypothetical protein